VSIAVCICVHSHMSKKQIFRRYEILCVVRVTCGHDSVLLLHCNMLYTTGFMDDIIFSHNGPYGMWCYLYRLWLHEQHTSSRLSQYLTLSSYTLTANCAPGEKSPSTIALLCLCYRWGMGNYVFSCLSICVCRLLVLGLSRVW